MIQIRRTTVVLTVLASLVLALLGSGAAAQPDPDHCPPGWERRGLCTSEPEPDPDPPEDPDDPDPPEDPEPPEPPEDPDDPDDPEDPEDPEEPDAPALDADVLVVVDDDQPGTTSQALVDHLTDRDATVTTVTDDAADDGDADGMDLILISPDVSASTVGSTFRDAPVAQVNLRSSNWRPHNQALGNDERPDTLTSQLTIVDADHPAAAGTTGTVDVGATVGWYLDDAGADAHTVATTTDGDPALVVYETGSHGTNGAFLPARRGLLGIDEDAWADTNDTLFDLLDGLIDWTVAGDIADPPEDPEPPEDPDDPDDPEDPDGPGPGPDPEDPSRADPVDPASASHTVSRGTGTADCEGNLSSVRPGDVVAIESGDRGRLRIENCHGTEAAPIVFVNDGGVVSISASSSTYAALDIRDSSNLRVTGSGAPGGGGRTVGAAYPENRQDAGIRVSGAERGVAFKFLEVFNDRYPRGGVVYQNLELDHIEAGPTSKNGIHGPESDRLSDDYTVAGFRIHHNYVHRGATHECMYLGSGNYPDPYADTGAWEIDHNLCSHNGRDGIQLGNAWYGHNRIHHNVIRHVGQADNQDSFGIILRRGSTADVYNNYIYDSGRDGIRDQGIEGSRYYNNVVVRGGHFTSSSNRGLRLSTSRDAAPAEHLQGNPGGAKVWNNTIVGFEDGGIHFTNDAGRATNEARNNIMWNTGGGVSTSSGSDATTSNNLTANPQFVDPNNDNYRLRSASPAIDAGHDLPGDVDHDITGTRRPQGNAWDIGAYEHGG